MTKAEQLNKKDEFRYQCSTLYTTSPKFFLKYYACNEVEECGICLSGEAISRIGMNANDVQTNVKVENKEDKLVPFPTAKEAVDKYKTALKVIDVEDVDRILTAKQLLEWIKEDIIDIDKSSFVIYGILWLFSDKSFNYSTLLATLCLLCNLDYYEIFRMVSAIFVRYDKKSLLEDEVMKMGFSELISEPIKREDLKLYMKVKDSNFRFKQFLIF